MNFGLSSSGQQSPAKNRVSELAIEIASDGQLTTVCDPSAGGISIHITLDGDAKPVSRLKPDQMLAPSHNLVAPAINGTAQVGATLRVTPGLWLVDPGTAFVPNYQWLANGAPVQGETAPQIVVAPALAGKMLECRETVAGASVLAAAVSVR